MSGIAPVLGLVTLVQPVGDVMHKTHSLWVMGGWVMPTLDLLLVGAGLRDDPEG